MLIVKLNWPTSIAFYRMSTIFIVHFVKYIKA